MHYTVDKIDLLTDAQFNDLAGMCESWRKAQTKTK